MCYSAGSISQAVNPCPMCKVFSHQKCPHIRETCRNRTAHPRMDVLYLRNAEVESFKGCGFCKWANQDPPSTRSGYNNPGWPGCCRPPSPNEVEKIPAADWPAVSKVHGMQIPLEVEDILKLILPPLALKPGSSVPQSSASLRSPSRLASRKGNGVALSATPSKSHTKPITVAHNRGRQGSVTPCSSSASRSSSSAGVSCSLPSSPTVDNQNHRYKTSVYCNNGEGSSRSSPSRKSAEEYNNYPTSPRRYSSGRRPTLTPATTSVSVSRIIASDTRSSERRLHDSPSTLNRRGSSSNSSNSPPAMTPRNGDSFLVPRTDVESRSNSSGSDGMLSDSTITSEGFTDYLSDESEEELQRQAEARAAVLAQNQMEELEFKMARQQLARVGLEPPKAWTQTNTPTASPTKNINHSTMSSRNGKISAHSFAIAATAMMQTGQARG